MNQHEMDYMNHFLGPNWNSFWWNFVMLGEKSLHRFILRISKVNSWYYFKKHFLVHWISILTDPCDVFSCFKNVEKEHFLLDMEIKLILAHRNSVYFILIRFTLVNNSIQILVLCWPWSSASVPLLNILLTNISMSKPWNI